MNLLSHTSNVISCIFLMQNSFFSALKLEFEQNFSDFLLLDFELNFCKSSIAASINYEYTTLAAASLKGESIVTVRTTKKHFTVPYITGPSL